MAELKQGKSDSPEWFLRVNGGTEFGPVSTEGLIRWAEQGRVLPGHEISSDRRQWTPPTALECLDMRWYVKDEGEELRGPFNRLAAEALAQSGKLSGAVRILSSDQLDAPADGGQEAAAPAAESAVLTELRAEVAGLRLELDEALAAASKATAAKQKALDRTGGLEAELRAAHEELAGLGLQLDEALAAKQQALERTATLEAEQGSVRTELDGLRQQLSAACAAETAAKERLEQREALCAELEAAREELRLELEGARQQVENNRRHHEDATALTMAAEEGKRAAEDLVRKSEQEMAELLNDSNARDIKYQERISELEKLCSQTPEEAAEFFADRDAIHELINTEVVELGRLLEQEKSQAEQFKQWSAQRQQSLHERYQRLMRHAGKTPEELTRRTLREQTADPRLARLRAELENLRVTHQREMRLAETREREWQERLRMQEASETRQRSQVVEAEKKAQRVPELEEALRRRDRELATERKHREDEREQFEVSQRALLKRIDTLERETQSAAPGASAAAEAQNVKLASWMRLKK